MKIAYINADADVPVFGTQGCSVHVQEILIAFLKREDDVHLFTTRLGNETPEQTAGLTVHLISGTPRGDLAARENQAITTNQTLRQMLDRESEKGAFDLIYERYSLWSHAGMEFACERNIPGILEVNAPLLEEQVARRALVNRGAAEEIAMRTFRSATMITAVSRQLAHLVAQHPTARGKIQVVPNAVNPSRFEEIGPLPDTQDGFVIGFVGTLKGAHGLTTLIESFHRVAHELPGARLLIVGDGPEREQLDRDIGARELAHRVRFTGAMPPESVAELMGTMHVAVLPYPPLAHFYSSPLKLYEYMAAGLPIVASRIGQIEEAIQDGETGILVTPGDAAAMAMALIDLYQHPELRQRLGTAARGAVQAHTWDNAVAAILAQAGLAAR